jgi:hypothetical protein
VLRSVADGGTARASLADDGEVRLLAAGDSVRDRLVDLLLIVRDAQRDGTWKLLKACANDECQWAFYDRSRNHGGTWCEMSVCGNKLKNRAFRARALLGRQVPHQRGGQRAQPVQRPVQRDRRNQAAAAPAQPGEHEARGSRRRHG